MTHCPFTHCPKPLPLQANWPLVEQEPPATGHGLVAGRVAVGAEMDTSVVGVGVVIGETVEGDEEFEGPRNA
jgi:hypothetical protein